MQNLKKRQEIERRLVRKLLRVAKAAGWNVAYVYDGGDKRVKAQTEEQAMDAVFAVDDSTIQFNKFIDGKLVRAWAQIVLGNDGWDAIADYSAVQVFDDQVMGQVNEYQDQLEAA